MARPVGSDGVQTRERILDVALELFTHQGYEKTSLRDIGARVGISKAALYYYFERKEDIFLELHRRLHVFAMTLTNEIEALPDGPARVALWPQVTDRMVDFMIENRALMQLHHRNRSALVSIHVLREAELPDIDARMEAIVASPAIPLRERVRMAATVGVITEVFAENAGAFEDVPAAEMARLVRETIADVLGTSATPRAGSEREIEPEEPEHEEQHAEPQGQRAQTWPGPAPEQREDTQTQPEDREDQVENRHVG